MRDRGIDYEVYRYDADMQDEEPGSIWWLVGVALVVSFFWIGVFYMLRQLVMG